MGPHPGTTGSGQNRPKWRRFSPALTRLNRLLRSLDGSVDLLVVSAEKFEYWRETAGNVYFEAATEGRDLIEAACGFGPRSTKPRLRLSPPTG